MTTTIIIIAVFLAVVAGIIILPKKSEEKVQESGAAPQKPKGEWDVVCVPSGMKTSVANGEADMIKIILCKPTPVTEKADYQVDFKMNYANGETQIEQKGTIKSGSVVECGGKAYFGVMLLEAPAASVSDVDIRIF